MKFKKTLVSVLTGALAACLLCASALGVAYEGPHTQHTTDGYTYDTWATLYLDGSNTFRAGAWISVVGNFPRNQGCLGALALLCDRYGDTIRASNQEEMLTNKESDYFMYAVTPTGSSSDLVYATGRVMVKTMYGTEEYTLTKTATYSASRAALVASLGENLTDGQAYSTTASGETYGSALLFESVGTMPDLISAVNDDGLRGYIRYEDVSPDLNTEAEFAAYQALNSQDRTIPLYDLSGAVIGQFAMPALDIDPETIPEVRATIEALNMRVELMERWGPLMVDGGWPVNSKGQTYGPIGLSEVFGTMPDLVSAVNDDGVRGFIKISSDPNAPAPVSDDGTSPLYDSEGNVIGEFVSGCGTLSEEEIRDALD